MQDLFSKAGGEEGQGGRPSRQAGRRWLHALPSPPLEKHESRDSQPLPYVYVISLTTLMPVSLPLISSWHLKPRTA